MWFADLGLADIDQVGGKNASVGEMVRNLTSAGTPCKSRGRYVGTCGQSPSDHPDLAEWLLEQEIDSISLNPDTLGDTWIRLGGGARQIES